MPGDTPQEAVTAFLGPLRAALSVLDGVGHIGLPRHGLWIKYKPVTWVLNGSNGMKLGDIGTLHASMTFRVIDTDPSANEMGKPLDGAPLTCSLREAENFLTDVEAPHRLHRTWSSRLDLPAPQQ